MATHKTIKLQDKHCIIKEKDSDTGAVVSIDHLFDIAAWINYDGTKTTLTVMTGGQLFITDTSATPLVRINNEDVSELNAFELMNRLSQVFRNVLK